MWEILFMTTQMIVRLDSKTKSKLTKLAQAEGKNTSQVIRELIEDYIQNRDMGSYIDDLWDRVGKKLKGRNIGSKEIEQAILDNRASKK
jgi:predicted DNA-binding protein